MTRQAVTRVTLNGLTLAALALAREHGSSRSILSESEPMPEGPEIRRMVDRIDASVGRRRTDQVNFAFERFKPFESTLAGRRVASVAARGKAVLVFFDAAAGDTAWCVYSHNQLYGQWRTGRAHIEPKTNRQLRFAIYAGANAARLYSASDIRVLQPDRLDEVDYLARLGPDPLNRPGDSKRLASQLDDQRFAGRNLGGLLLDQGFIAGIGNYLRSEILHAASLHPARKPRALAASERSVFVDATLRLLDRAYQLEGVTNDPQRAERLKQDGVRFGARRYAVFARAGLPCYVCNTPIVKTTVASRRLYYCPACQRVPTR